MKKLSFTAVLFFMVLCLNGCHKTTGGSSPTAAGDSIATPHPSARFVATNYIELDKIGRISKFRSSAGHDYHDSFEQCRSMKHYFEPKDSVDWSAIRIFAPVSGKVSRLIEEWACTQVQIQSTTFPQYYFIIFHINLAAPLNVGDPVQEGQLLGHHIGSQTTSDIAVGVAADSGWTLVPYCELLNDSLFQRYQARGVAARSDLVISRQARDADTLRCSGDAFLGQGSIGDWVVLR